MGFFSNLFKKNNNILIENKFDFGYIKILSEIYYQFRIGKIGSIEINGVDYYNLNKISNDLVIDTIYVGKKYSKLFKGKELDLFIKYFTKDSENVCNRINKTPIYLEITNHARERIIQRSLILSTLYKELWRENDLCKELDILTTELKNNYNGENIKDYLISFCKSNSKTIDKIIFKFTERSSVFLKDKISKKREQKHGFTNYYLYYPFKFVYSVDRNQLTTIELTDLQYTNGCHDKSLTRKINKEADKLLSNIILGTTQNKLK